MRTNVSLNRFPYTAINLLHIQTKEDIIRRELLFKVGDRFDTFLILETERNLRALSFIRAARIAKFPQRDGTIALVVHVNDAWTTEPQINLGGVNKVDSTEFGFKEKNFLGYGKTIGVFYNRGVNFIERRYQYFDPRLFGTRWQLDAKAANNTLGRDRSISIEHPFFSADTRWAARGFHERNDDILDEFVNGAKVSRFNEIKETNETSLGTKVGKSRYFLKHASLRYRKESQRYFRTPETNSSRAVPESQDFKTIFLDMDGSLTRYVELTHIEKMTRVEDFNLGPAIRVSPGYSPYTLTNKSDTGELQTTYEQKFLSKKSQFLNLKAEYSGRDTLREPSNQRYGFTGKYYNRSSDFHTLVVHTRVESGHRLDAGNEIKLGGNNGLRGFKEDELVGNRSWLLNIEDRLFLVDEVFNLVAIGSAVFYDAGYVWPEGRPINFSKMKSDVGVGLRFGLTRSSNEVIVRLDFAYRLQRVHTDDPKFVVTFGSSQAF